MADTGKIVEVIFENALETHNHQTSMMDMVDTFKPNSGDFQNAGNFVWRPVQQQAPILDGWDLTGLETDIIEETYPAVLGEPANDFFEQRADQLRDMAFWERRGKESGKKQATELNRRIAALVAQTGSIFYRSDTTSGYNFIAQAESFLDERQVAGDERYFTLNTRDNQLFAEDLAGRQTVQGRPETSWAFSQIGQNVAGFDVYRGSFLPNLVGGADPATTVTADQSFAPEGGTVSATGVVTNVDYRIATIPVADSSSYNIGDRVTFSNAGTPVTALGLSDKTDSDQAATFAIVGIPDATSIEIFFKPIALSDPGLNTLQTAYANVDTQILNTATVNRVNIDASNKTNIFWTRESIEITAGDAPVQLLNEFGGQKVISKELKSGLTMYMAYDGNIDDLTFKCRLFTWYQGTNKNPMANGAAVTF